MALGINLKVFGNLRQRAESDRRKSLRRIDGFVDKLASDQEVDEAKLLRDLIDTGMSLEDLDGLVAQNRERRGLLAELGVANAAITAADTARSQRAKIVAARDTAMADFDRKLEPLDDIVLAGNTAIDRVCVIEMRLRELAPVELRERVSQASSHENECRRKVDLLSRQLGGMCNKLQDFQDSLQQFERVGGCKSDQEYIANKVQELTGQIKWANGEISRLRSERAAAENEVAEAKAQAAKVYRELLSHE